MATATGNILTKGVWNNIVITYDGSGLGSGIKLYKNGALEDADAYTGDIGNYYDVLFFGGSINTNYVMDGRIAASKVYSKALTAAEVLQNYNAGKLRFGL